MYYIMHDHTRLQADMNTKIRIHIFRYLQTKAPRPDPENELRRHYKLEEQQLVEHEEKLRLLREKLRKEELKMLRGEQAEGDVEAARGHAPFRSPGLQRLTRFLPPPRVCQAGGWPQNTIEK